MGPSKELVEKCTGSPILPRPFVFRGERPLPPLGRMGLPVHFSTSSFDGRSASTSTDVPGQRYTYSSILCSIKVVSTTSDQMPSTSSSSRRIFTVPDDMPGHNIPQPPRVVQASRLDTLRSALTDAGLSEVVIDTILRAHKPTTLNQYQSIWAKFISFLRTKECLITNVTINIVCEFLYLHQNQFDRQYRTITAYKSALRLPILYAANVEINCLTVDLYMRGAYNTTPPLKAKEMPLWSLNGLLTFLDTARFEPLETVHYRFLVQKTLCLILLSSGRRIGEITNLSDKSSRNRADSRLHLKWLVDFKPKHDTPSFRPPCPSISKLADPTGVQLTLCPIRAYHIFKNRAISWHRAGENVQDLQPLWVKPNASLPNSITELSKAFVSLVKDYRKFNNLPINISIGPHQTRKFSGAYSVQLDQKKETIVKVMGFSSFTILKKNYVSKVSPLTVPCALPGGSHFPRPEHIMSESD